MTAQGQIGQYRIIRKIGAGGMGMVFLGEHLLLQRRAAIKTLQPSLSMQPEIVERFFNEARATSAISDPGIVQVFDFGYHVDGTAYIVLELLEGEGLADRLDRLGVLPIPHALRIARQVASSLAAAHAMCIVHRDLKPENIFLIRDCEAQGGERTKILDFGICAVSGAPSTATPPETMIGTPVYMSPEQCRGGDDGDHRSDIYALGCVLFQMLTGSTPFERDCVRDVILAHLAEEPPPPSALRTEIPPLVDELVRRCLAKSPEDRFSSMVELGTAIERVLARLSGSEEPVMEVPPAVPLGTGFRSDFDANVAARGLRLEDPTITCTASAAVGRAPLRRAALAVALLGGAVLASLTARLTEGDSASAAATVEVTGAGEGSPAPAPAPVASPAAAAPAGIAAPVGEPAPAAAPVAEPAPVAAEAREATAPVAAEAREATAPAAAGARPASSSPSAAAKQASSLSRRGRAPAAPRPPAEPARAASSASSSSPSQAPARPTPLAPPAPAQPRTQAGSEDLYDMR